MGNETKSSRTPYKLRQRKGRAWEIRGTHKGFRLDTSTGEGNEGAATRKAAQMWADHVKDVETGHAASRAKARGCDEVTLDACGERWLLTKPSLSVCTYRAHVYRIALLSEHFATVHDCTKQNVESFIELRLCEVQRQTLVKDLRVLQPILKMCAREGTIAGVPVWEMPAQNISGTTAKNARQKSVKATPEQIERILALLPERTRDQKFPIRAVCTFLWETGLRPWLLWRIETPLHWEPGMKRLNITKDVSKIRLDRLLELSPRAIEQLEFLHELYGDNPKAGALLAPAWNDEGELIIPNMRATLTKAAKEVLGVDRGARFHMSCFRPNRITQLIHMGVVPAKVGWLVGQTSSSIQDRYLKTNEDDVDGIYDELFQPAIGDEGVGQKVS